MSYPQARLAVLISGYGSNLQAILDACQDQSLPGKVVVVISNQVNAFGLERASQAGVPAIVKVKPKAQDRQEYDAELAKLVESYQPDWVILAGWMRILTSEFLHCFPGKVINLHPALPGTFPGTHAIERAFDAFQRQEIQGTGVMIHLVPDEGVDNGPVLAQEAVPMVRGESIDSFEERIHQVEHRLLINTLIQVITGKP